VTLMFIPSPLFQEFLLLDGLDCPEKNRRKH